MTSQVVQGSWFYTGGYRCFRNKKCQTFFKEALRVSTQTIRTGSQDCSTKKKVSVLIINSLLHAVMSSIHCAGAGYYFFKGHARGTREGEGPPLLFSPRASLRLLSQRPLRRLTLCLLLFFSPSINICHFGNILASSLL